MNAIVEYKVETEGENYFVKVGPFTSERDAEMFVPVTRTANVIRREVGVVAIRFGQAAVQARSGLGEEGRSRVAVQLEAFGAQLLKRPHTRQVVQILRNPRGLGFSQLRELRLAFGEDLGIRAVV